MSSRYEISSVNKGLFSRFVLAKQLTSVHKLRAKSIFEYFKNEKAHNPYHLNREQLLSLSEDDTIDHYVSPILKCLGYNFRKKHPDLQSKFPDVWLFESAPEETSPEYFQTNNLTVLEAKAYRVDLDKGDGRDERPPRQILKYVTTNTELNPLKRWGVLTNGYKWRLYSADGEDRYIEFDIDHALENLEELELFCLVFSPESYAIPADRVDILTRCRTESLDSWVKVTTEIQTRGQEILLQLMNGFVLGGADLESAKDRAYTVLFRLLYILFVESKHLIPAGTVQYATNSLRSLLHDIHQVTMREGDIAKRLELLFSIYRTGEKILPKRFGGEYFEEPIQIRVKNRYLKSALELLTVFEKERSVQKFFDYSSLNVELIGNLYEATLALKFEMDLGLVTIKKIKKKTGEEVHSTGTTYTPPNVVRYLVDSVIPEKLEGLPLICDPACGSGHFLVQALRRLSTSVPFELTGSETLQQHKRVLSLKCIFGNDINGLAAKLTRLMLAVETAEPAIPPADHRRNVISTNALIPMWSSSLEWIRQFKNKELTESGGFDLVIGNPPYVRADEPGLLEMRGQIVKTGQYKYLKKKWDLFVPFVELAIGLTKARSGAVAYVVSDGITYAPYAKDLTAALSKDSKIKFVSHFKEAFQGWAFPATCFVFDWSKADAISERRIHVGNDPFKILACEETDTPFQSAANERSISIRSSWEGATIGDVAYLSVGMVLNSHEKFKKIKFKKENLILQGCSDKEHPVRYLDNEDLGAGYVLRRDPNYIEYGPDSRVPKYVRRPTFPELHQDTRLLLSSSKQGSAAVMLSDVAIVSHNTLILKLWKDLRSCENSSIAKKVKLPIPDPIKDKKVVRKCLENLSQYCSYELILGVLLSATFRKWINDDKRHKHVLVPDVISEMPFPLMVREKSEPLVVKFDLSFAKQIDRLERSTVQKSHFEVGQLIESIVREIQPGKGFPSSLHQSYLDKLVELFYRPILDAKSVTDVFRLPTLLASFALEEKKLAGKILEKINEADAKSKKKGRKRA